MNKIKQLFKSLFENEAPSAPSAPLIEEGPGATIVTSSEEERVVEKSEPISADQLIIKSTTNNEIDSVFDGSTRYAVQERTVEMIKETPIEKIRWKPDDALWKKYQEADSIVGTIPSQLYKIKEARQKIERRREQAESYLNKEHITPYDRLQALELKQDIMQEEGIVSEKEQKLAQAQALTEDSIFEDYAEYLMKAQKWIVNTPEVKGIISARDILNSQAIYISAKKAMDQITVSPPGKRRDESMERLARLDLFFDLQGAHKESRAVHLLDFQKFAKDFNTAKQHLFDRLDFQIAGIDAVQKIPDRQQEDVKPVEAGIGSLQGSTPMHLQTVDNKKDELHEILKNVPLGLEDSDMEERLQEEIRKRQKPEPEVEYGTPLSEVLGEENEAKQELLLQLKDLEKRGVELSGVFSIKKKIEDIQKEIERATEELNNQSTKDRFEAEIAKRNNFDL